MDDSTEVIVDTNKRGGPFSLLRMFIPSFTSTLLVIYLVVSLLMNGDMKPSKRGFFCDDSSLKYPFKQETITLRSLLTIALFVPGIIIKICDSSLSKLLMNSPYQAKLERSRLSSGKRRKMSDNDEQKSNIEEEELIVSLERVKRCQLVINEDDSDDQELNQADNLVNVSGENVSGESDTNSFTCIPLDNEDEQRVISMTGQILHRAFGEFQLFFFGFSTTTLFTGIGKITCGRFRPHFFARCQPDVDCSTPENANRYIEKFTCSNIQLRPRDMHYIMTSWPSGHAAIMFFSMVYMIIYLNTVIPVIVQLSSQKVRRRFDPLILYAIYVLMIGLACYISLTRISDYHHHPLDVFSGLVIGTLIAIALSKCLSRQYLQKDSE